MSGLLRPIGAGGGGGDGGRIPRTALENNCTFPETSNTTDRKHVFGTPTSQLSSNTDISSKKATADNKPRVSDVGMSPFRDSVGKLVHPRKDGARYSEDNAIPPDGVIIQPDEQDASPRGEEGRREGRWGSARARLGSVFSGRHSIREGVSRVRRKSVDPSHLMNDLNPGGSGSRANRRPLSAHGSDQQFSPAPDTTTAPSFTGSTFFGHARQGSDVPGGSSPSRLSSKFTSWKNNLSTPKGRGRELSQEHGTITDSPASEQLRSSSTPPPQKFKVRVNRFLRSGRRSVSSITGSPASEDTPAPGAGREHLRPLASTSTAQTPPYPSSAESSTARETPRHGIGFRQAVRRGVSSARRRMSVPFLSTPPLSDDNASVSDAPAIEPPERPQTVPVEKRGALRTPGGSQFVLSGEPGHDFLPSEANNFIPPITPPVVTENFHTDDWLGQDFEHISMIQSRPPLFPPGMEESPPLSPWARTSSESQPWLKLTATPPRLPEIAPVAPFAIGELMARDLAAGKALSGGRQSLSDKYWTVASGSDVGRNGETQTKDKGKERATSNASEYLMPPGERFYLESRGKSIEVLDEEKRRKSRDTGIMGLDPEVTPSREPLTMFGLRERDGGGEFTYAAAVREIAGLGRFPKRPPPDTGTDDVSVPMPECDYDLPLPNFRFSILSKPSPSSNEPDVSLCAASSSLAQEKSGSISDFLRLAPAHIQIFTTTTNTTTRTATAASTNPSTSITSPSDYNPYNYQMLLSSNRPYLFVLQELSSGTYIKITPQKNSSPVSRSLSTLTPSYPETPVPSQASPSDARSPVSVRFVNSNGLLIYGTETYEEMDNDNVDDEEEDKKEKEKE
ncbi:hypothetical protein Q9L58_006355 [Maublancomyces gigas]|uniref:Uncharacterized protein n=1 Tax=Discina gigas TaxID=1032678 RepID=A0ABR3GFY1_9PEZI